MSATYLRFAIRETALLRCIVPKTPYPLLGDGLFSGRAADTELFHLSSPVMHGSPVCLAQGLVHIEDPREGIGCNASWPTVLR